jgi:hypothetical protein
MPGRSLGSNQIDESATIRPDEFDLRQATTGCMLTKKVRLQDKIRTAVGVRVH